MITIDFSGRLGNNLIQYCFARILAENMGRALEFSGESHIPETFENICPLDGGRHLGNLKEFNDTLAPNVGPGQIMEHNGDIRLKGYWQKAQFYYACREKLREWCHLPDWRHASMVNRDDVILHIRREDYVDARSDLNLDYYGRLLEQNNYRSIHIVGVGIDETVRAYFKGYSPVYHNRSAAEDFKILQYFNNVILSNSSFCWLATLISDRAEKIFFPEPVSGYWSSFQRQKLFIPLLHTRVINVPVGNNSRISI